MLRKKIVFVIVKGPTDDTALGLLLTKAFNPAVVYLHITHGDITSDYASESANILRRIDSIVTAYRTSNHLTKKHFQEIVHIIDTDGAFIPAAVVEDTSAEDPVYTPTQIHTAYPDEIRQRNQIRSENLNRLSSVREIGVIPYQVYYMSCNLDHVLYNKQNSTDAEKEQDAMLFAKQYKDNLDDFVAFMNTPGLLTDNNYVQSWKYIKDDLHSLERHSNLGICLNKAAEDY